MAEPVSLPDQGKVLVVDDEPFLRDAVAASLLMLNPGRVLTRAQLLDHVRNYDFGGSDGVVSTHIAYLRRKLAQYGPDLIRTQRGIGYGLRIPASAGPAGR